MSLLDDIKEIDEDAYDYLNSLDDDGKTDIAYDTYSTSLAGLFVWHFTPQGDRYWMDIHRILCSQGE